MNFLEVQTELAAGIILLSIIWSIWIPNADVLLGGSILISLAHQNATGLLRFSTLADT